MGQIDVINKQQEQIDEIDKKNYEKELYIKISTAIAG
jgi:hypothetical protein